MRVVFAALLIVAIVCISFAAQAGTGGAVLTLAVAPALVAAGAWLWSFLNSEAGLMVVGLAAAWAWRKWGKGDQRVEKILAIIKWAFPIVEGLAAQNPNLRGKLKYLKYLELVMNKMQSEGLGLPTGPEKMVIDKAAEALSSVEKETRPLNGHAKDAKGAAVG